MASSVFDIALAVSRSASAYARCCRSSACTRTRSSTSRRRLSIARSRSRALLHPLVEVLQRPVEPLLGGAPLGDVLERAEDADDLAVEVAQRDLLGLDPAQVAAGPPQPLDDPDDGLAGLGDVGVPVHEPVGAELCVVGPRHVAVGLADQVVRFGPAKAANTRLQPR